MSNEVGPPPGCPASLSTQSGSPVGAHCCGSAGHHPRSAVHPRSLVVPRRYPSPRDLPSETGSQSYEIDGGRCSARSVVVNGERRGSEAPVSQPLEERFVVQRGSVGIDGSPRAQIHGRGKFVQSSCRSRRTRTASPDEPDRYRTGSNERRAHQGNRDVQSHRNRMERRDAGATGLK